ncbi:MAG TPA: translation factor GTPase family protein [Mycobacteriales bacterium]|nr:translation factor GTPase family protein [Mycobacteriales bacterium]
MRTLNLGILAHVDAGKTSLTERLLHNAGVIDEIGSVDAGNTQTDTLALEQQRGITIKSAVVSFTIGDVTVNLIDTPGHPDFIAEVERVLSVLDGAVLVISAVEGVQPQTRVLMRTLQRLRIPTLIFVNKIDRAGARSDELVQDIAGKLTPAVIAMGTAGGLGTRNPVYTPRSDPAFRRRLTELLAEHDETLLAAYVADETLEHDQLMANLATQSRRALVHPVYFGSAITGAGIEALTEAIPALLPAIEGDADAPALGTVFKVERGPAGEKIAYVRMFAGTLHTRERLHFGDDREAKVTAISVFEDGHSVQSASVCAGRIGKLTGLHEVRIGDTIGKSEAVAERHYFAPPTLETVVVPSRPELRGALRNALDQLSEQDPLINVRQDDARQELFVSLYGEVQKEVIESTLATDYGFAVEFEETTTICIERPCGTGEAVDFNKKDGNPFLATVGLRIEPGPVNSGVRYELATEVLGTMPPAFFKAVEDTVRETLNQGIHGWQVTDCLVTLTHTGYSPRQSHAHQGFSKGMSSTGADFRGVTPLVVMNALSAAGTMVFEPIEHFRLEVPADTFGGLLPVLGSLRAAPGLPVARGGSYIVEGSIPASAVHQLHQQLPALTRGEGVLESVFDHHRPVSGEIPSRPRTDHNPLDRKEYLLHVERRIQ